MKIKRGSTSVRRTIFIGDSSSSTGAGLTGLVYNTASLSAYYYPGDGNAAVAITLATATLGTFTSGGFIAVDGTNMPGWYEIGIPNAALDGGNEVAIQLKGAANMIPVNIYIELDAVDYQTDAFGALKPTTAGRTLDVTGTGSIQQVETVQDVVGDVAQIGDGGVQLNLIPWNSAWDTEIQSECADALTAYDPPTNAEMEARTLAAASYGTAANQTTILARLGSWTGSGINTILGAFRALMAKASALTPTDISTGTTFDNTTDALEAIRDRGDAAWTTGGGGGGGGGTVVTLPASLTQQSRVEGTQITAFINENLDVSHSVYDSSLDPVDLSALTLKFVIATKNETHVLTINDADIDVTGTDSNTFTLTLPDTFTDTLGSYQYSLRDASSDVVLAHGPLLVRYAATE